MLLPLVSAGTPHTVPQRHGRTVTLQIDLHVVVVVAAGNDSHRTPVVAAGGGQRVAVCTVEWGPTGREYIYVVLLAPLCW